MPGRYMEPRGISMGEMSPGTVEYQGLHTHRQTDRQTDRHTHTHTYTHQFALYLVALLTSKEVKPLGRHDATQKTDTQA